MFFKNQRKTRKLTFCNFRTYFEKIRILKIFSKIEEKREIFMFFDFFRDRKIILCKIIFQKIKNNGNFQKCFKKYNVAYIGMTNRTTHKYLGIRTVLSPDSVLNLNVRFSAHDYRSVPILRTL